MSALRSPARGRACVAVLVLPLAGGDGGEPVRFNRDVRPILSNHCYECHGPDANQRKAELRLDRPGELFDDRGGHRVVVAGDPAGSELVRRITAEDAGERMPPPEFRHPLGEAQRATLVRWIEEGAVSESHWAYGPLQSPPVPEPEASDWIADPIDAFLLEGMARTGVQPSPQADRRTLIRRLSFDLTGLPPEPAEVEAFVADARPDAYERLVERLLASPHYGERMALFWLDLVRYADTVGYHGDQEWKTWCYRDWVIRAFDENMPFDQFTVEQLAGDLLPKATLQQRVAAGYNRLNMVTFEGGSQAREFLLKYAADRVRNVAGTWLGSTMGCTECHDHKFDPFSTRDFYSLSAFFADIEEVGVYTEFQKGFVPPEMSVPSPEQAAELERLDARIASARGALTAASPERATARRVWERRLIAELAATTEPVDVTWVDDEQANGGSTEGRWDFVGPEDGPVTSGKLARRQSGSGIVQHFFHGARRRATPGEGDRFFAWVWLDPDDPPETVMLQWNDGSWEHRIWWGEDRISFGGIGNDTPGHRRMGPLPPTGEWVRLEADPRDVGLGVGEAVNGMAFTQFGGTAYWDRAGLRTSRPSLALGGPPPEVIAVLEATSLEATSLEATSLEAPSERSAEQQSTVAAYWRSVAPELAGEREALARLEQERAALDASIPRTLATISIEPRTVRILPRGNWMDESGEVVEPTTPHFLPPLEVGERRATRLDLARWLVSPANPLTPRVLVNRLWRLFYGEGIARSVDDVGSQGEWPDHLELLDHLARDLVDSGWDLRATIRRMVSANAYRQSSARRPALGDVDPDNRLFARQNRRRLDAEFIRDAALAASGLMVREIGGPSVKPYQPAGYWAELNFPKRTWQHDTGDALYRRGMYTFWCRTFLHPTMKAFDAPPREECTARRPVSNTPLQALALLNDPAFVEAAGALARRILLEGGASDAERLDFAFRRVFSRPPRPEESEVVTALLTDQRAAYRADPGAATARVLEGESPQPPPELDRVELAAWTSVTRALLNTDEAITRR